MTRSDINSYQRHHEFTSPALSRQQELRGDSTSLLKSGPRRVRPPLRRFHCGLDCSIVVTSTCLKPFLVTQPEKFVVATGSVREPLLQRRSLVRQIARNGHWEVQTLLKHGSTCMITVVTHSKRRQKSRMYPENADLNVASCPKAQ